MKKLSGTGVAIVTPFEENGAIDFEGLSRLIKHIKDGGVEFVVLMGTTGESAVCTATEKQELLTYVKQELNGQMPLVLGMGGNDTAGLIQQIGATDFEGVDAILSVSPYYNKPTQEGIYQHFKAIAEKSPVPIILYNVPGRTSSNMTAETTLRLAHDFDNIIGMKEASGDIIQCMKIIRDRPEGFLVLSGDDAITLPMVMLGGDGVISVHAMACPQDFSNMVRAARNGENDLAKSLHYKQLDLIEALFVEGNPAGVKSALKHLGICGDKVRLPLVKVSNETDKLIKELLVGLK